MTKRSRQGLGIRMVRKPTSEAKLNEIRQYVEGGRTYDGAVKEFKCACPNCSSEMLHFDKNDYLGEHWVCLNCAGDKVLMIFPDDNLLIKKAKATQLEGKK